MADAAALHLRHDTIAIAAAADRDGRLSADQRACPHCSWLHEDLVLLATATPSSACPRRTRDFRLSAADAAHLRERSWTGWWGVIGSARDNVTRPLALALTTLGLAGVVLSSASTLVPGMGAGAASMPDRELLGAESGTDSSVPAASGTPSTTITDAPTREPVDGLPLLALSGSFLAAGGSIALVRWTVRRRGAVR